MVVWRHCLKKRGFRKPPRGPAAQTIESVYGANRVRPRLPTGSPPGRIGVITGHLPIEATYRPAESHVEQIRSDAPVAGKIGEVK
jgi:hypothetical protein